MQDAAPYAYAKACGIIGKSFVGKRISSLANLRSLSELDRLIFPEHYGDKPAGELLSDMEKRIVSRSVRQILVIIDSYENPPELLTRMLRAYEYSDFKTCLQYIAAGKKELPVICGIRRFRTVDFNSFPDISAMIKNTEFETLLSADIKSIQENCDITQIETKLDNFYYQSLIKSALNLSAEDRSIVQRLLAEEISLRNCTCALRLRSYYHKNSEETRGFMMDLKQGADNSLAKEAIESLDFSLDLRNSWESWKWECFLNPEEPYKHWTADPRYFQNAASRYIYSLAKKSFHRLPMSVSSIFCYIKLKQFEEDILTSIAEGLAMGLDSTGVFKLLEVTE